MKSVELTLEIENDKGELSRYPVQITPSENQGEDVTKTIPGVAVIKVHTSKFVRDPGFYTGYDASVWLRVQLLQNEKVSVNSMTGSGSYKQQGLSKNGEVDFENEVFVGVGVSFPDCIFSTSDFEDYDYTDEDSILEVNRFASTPLIINLYAKMLKWTYLPVRRRPTPFKLFRSSADNLILRDGDE